MSTNPDAVPPSIGVQRAFGAAGTAERFTSGEGTAFRVGDVVLKPVGDRDEAEWIGGILANVAERGFRVARPVAAADGTYVVDGWTAWQWVPGEATMRAWHDVAKAGNHFHDALRDTAKPRFVETRKHQWAIGDRVAFAEQDHALPNPIAEQVASLRACITENRLPSQVIHGDLTGNVLLADGLEPAIIDFSPYYRPVGYATAVIVIDAVAWFGAPFTLCELVEPAAERHELLARALIFRLVAAALNPTADDERIRTQSLSHAPITAHVLERLRRP